MEIRGKAAIVTGAGSGIGASIAARLAGEGASVVLAGRRQANLDATRAVIEGAGGVAFTHACDVTQEEACDALVERCVKTFGSGDILVNNAGIAAHGRLLADYDGEDFDRVLGANLKSAFLMSRAMLPVMAGGQGGCIVMISSVSGTTCFPGESLYGLSKHGMNALAQFIRVEYGARDVHAFSICPGVVDTDMGRSLAPAHMDRVLTAEQVAEWTVLAIRQSGVLAVAAPIVLDNARDPLGG